MERVLALGQDMALLWTRYAPLYLSGVVNTLLLAVAATVLGCLIAVSYTHLTLPTKRIV